MAATQTDTARAPNENGPNGYPPTNVDLYLFFSTFLFAYYTVETLNGESIIYYISVYVRTAPAYHFQIYMVLYLYRRYRVSRGAGGSFCLERGPPPLEYIIRNQYIMSLHRISFRLDGSCRGSASCDVQLFTFFFIHWYFFPILTIHT